MATRNGSWAPGLLERKKKSRCSEEERGRGRKEDEGERLEERGKKKSESG